MITLTLSCNDCGKFIELPVSAYYQEQDGKCGVTRFGIGLVQTLPGWTNCGLSQRCDACDAKWVERMQPVWKKEAENRKEKRKAEIKRLWVEDRKGLVEKMAGIRTSDTCKNEELDALIECLGG